MKNSVILFHSTNYAMWAAEELHINNIDCTMISVPRHLSSDCGYCVQIATENKLEAEDVLLKKRIEFEKIEDL